MSDGVDGEENPKNGWTRVRARDAPWLYVEGMEIPGFAQVYHSRGEILRLVQKVSSPADTAQLRDFNMHEQTLAAHQRVRSEIT